MADIILTTLFEQKKLEFHTEGQGGDRFRSDFLNAVNRAGRRINRDADLETRITEVTAVEGTIDLDETYEDVLSDIVTVNLVQMGQKVRRGTEDDYRQLVRQLPSKIDSIRQDIMNQAIDADTDDESDFVGLGGLG